MRSCAEQACCLLICAVLASPSALATDEKDGPRSGKAALGYLATSGNTENSNLNTSLEIGYRAGTWQHVFEAFAIQATENDATTAEAYELGWKSERNLSEHPVWQGQLAQGQILRLRHPAVRIDRLWATTDRRQRTGRAHHARRPELPIWNRSQC